MNYKDDLYERYITVQSSAVAPVQTLEQFRKEFPAFEGYFAGALPPKDAAIIDLGCGSGALVYWLMAKGYSRVQGIDVSKEQVERAHSLGLKNIAQADLRDFLKGKQGVFDAVFAVDILEHFTKPEAVAMLQMMFAALKPGGILFVKTPNGESVFCGRYLFGDFTHEVIFTERSLRELFSFIGFSGYAFKETAPAIHGFLSLVRWCAWRCVRLLLNAYLLIETGKRATVLTQNIIAIAKK